MLQLLIAVLECVQRRRADERTRDMEAIEAELARVFKKASPRRDARSVSGFVRRGRSPR
jgi:hypothetical protein